MTTTSRCRTGWQQERAAEMCKDTSIAGFASGWRDRLFAILSVLLQGILGQTSYLHARAILPRLRDQCPFLCVLQFTLPPRPRQRPHQQALDPITCAACRAAMPFSERML